MLRFQKDEGSFVSEYCTLLAEDSFSNTLCLLSKTVFISQVVKLAVRDGPVECIIS